MDVRKQHLPPTEVDILSPEHHHFDDIPFMIYKKTKKCMFLLLCICDPCYVDDDDDDITLYYTMLYCSLWITYIVHVLARVSFLDAKKDLKMMKRLYSAVLCCCCLQNKLTKDSNTFLSQICDVKDDVILHLHFSLFNSSCSLHFLILWLISVKILSQDHKCDRQVAKISFHRG